MIDPIKVLLVTGGYGSGTTALAGALARLGVPAPGPFFNTNDPRTPNSYEAVSFRDLMLSLVDEEKVSLRNIPDADRVAAIRKFSEALRSDLTEIGEDASGLPVLLKSPMACICLPHFKQEFDLQVVIVHRRFDAIEKTRERRRWTHNLGATGAKLLYNQVLTDLIAQEMSWLSISYDDLVREPERMLQRVVQYAGLGSLSGKVPEAARFIRR